MAAPMVSGAVALLLQDEPGLTPDQVKYRLMATANKSWSGYNASKAGAGYLDVFAAVNGATSESANTGILPSQLLPPALNRLLGEAWAGIVLVGIASAGIASVGIALAG